MKIKSLIIPVFLIVFGGCSRASYTMNYPNGISEKGSVRNGKHGKVVYYYSDGNKMIKGRFSHDMKIGRWKYYDTFEVLVKRIKYKKGNVIKTDSIGEYNSVDSLLYFIEHPPKQ